MEITIELDSIELDFVTTAATTYGSSGLASYLKTAAIATSEVVIIQRMEQLRPLVDTLPDAKASL